MSLLASASQRWFSGSPFNYDVRRAPGSGAPVLPGPAAERPGGQWQRPDKFQQQKFLEGPLMVFSLGASYVPLPDRADQRAGGLFAAGYACGKALGAVAGYWTRVGTNVALPWGFTVGLSAEFRWTDFNPGWHPFIADDSTPREDQTRILQATLLNRAITVFGFSPQIAFSNQVRESNAQLYDFQRNLVEMRWVRQF